MRRNGTIEAIWDSGRYFGANKPSARVTINRTWTNREIAQSNNYTRNGRRNPVRSYDNGTEVDVPIGLIKSIQIDRSMDADCASLTLTLLNAHPDGLDRADGTAYDARGMLSQRRTINGARPAQAPSWWPHLVGDDVYWGDVQGGGDAHSYGAICQGNMMRTYQGYGGVNVCTGVWIIDRCAYNARGNIEVQARDVGALLVDQTLYARGTSQWGGGLVADLSYPTYFYSAKWNQDVNGDPNGKPPTSTNYDDLTEIVQIVAAWAGFADPAGGLIGGFQQTGITSGSIIGPTVFDKKSPIDAIHTIRDIVGFTTFVDQDGGFRFNRGNQWKAGNDVDGAHTGFAFHISEDLQLLDYTATGSKTHERSTFIVAEGDPFRRGADPTVPRPRYAAYDTNTGNPNTTDGTKNMLHGMRSIAMIPVDHRVTQEEMTTIAELTGIRAWFQRRRGSVTIPGNPLIDIDDQVQITERVTFDHFLHHVNAIQSNHDLETGVWTMNLDTHWMGPARDFELVVVGNGHVYYNTTQAKARELEEAVGRYETVPLYEAS